MTKNRMILIKHPGTITKNRVILIKHPGTIAENRVILIKHPGTIAEKRVILIKHPGYNYQNSRNSAQERGTIIRISEILLRNGGQSSEFVKFCSGTGYNHQN